MRFPVCRFSARLRRVRHGQPVRTPPCVLERVCSIKPGKPNVKRRETRKTQIRFRRNPVFSEDSSRPLGEQCVTLRGPILTLSESSDIACVDTAPAAFNSQADEFLISWDQLIGTNWAVYDQRLAVDGTLLGENNPIIEGTDTFIEPAVAYNADTNQYFITWRFQGPIRARRASITLSAGSWIPLVFRLEMWFMSPTPVSSRRWYLTLSLASSRTMHGTSRRRNSWNLLPADRWRWDTACVADTDHHRRSARSSR